MNAMIRRLREQALALTGGLAIAAVHPFAQAQDKALAELPRDIAPVHTLAMLPPGTFLENLVFARDGTLLIASYYAQQVLRYRSADGVGVFAQLAGHPVSLAANALVRITVGIRGAEQP